METTITRRSFIVVPVITDRVEDNVRARYQMARIIRREVLPHGRGFKSKSNRVRRYRGSVAELVEVLHA